MRAHGRRDREQNSFMENIALAVWGDVPLATLEIFTGLSRRMIEQDRDMRLKFNVDVEKANRGRTSTSSYVTPTQHNESDDSGFDSENDSSDDETEMKTVAAGKGDEEMMTMVEKMKKTEKGIICSENISQRSSGGTTSSAKKSSSFVLGVEGLIP
jgi:hypothetical protein